MKLKINYVCVFILCLICIFVCISKIYSYSITSWSFNDKEKYGLCYQSFLNSYNEFSKYKKPVETVIVDIDINFTNLDKIAHIISNRLWVNKDDLPNNKIDDDKDGFINNYYGIDFLRNPVDPKEIFNVTYKNKQSDPFHSEFMHGNIIVQTIDKIAISPAVKVYLINAVTIDDFVNAFKWIIAEKKRGTNIKVINLPSTYFLKLHKYTDKEFFNNVKEILNSLDFEDQDFILVTGAGNNPPQDSNPLALLNFHNIFSVNAHNKNGEIVFNHESKYVHFTVPEVFSKGTSESAAVTSAIIATYFSIRPDYSVNRMIQFIKNSIVKDKKISNHTLFGGYLQYDNAIFK